MTSRSRDLNSLDKPVEDQRGAAGEVTQHIRRMAKRFLGDAKFTNEHLQLLPYLTQQAISGEAVWSSLTPEQETILATWEQFGFISGFQTEGPVKFSRGFWAFVSLALYVGYIDAIR